VVDDGGWIAGARRCPSPNFDARPPGAVIDLLVIHSISLPPGIFGSGDVERLFANQLDALAQPLYPELAEARVSSHFLIARDGRLTQFVSCVDRAWHAGVSNFCGRTRCNDFSLGVELEGSDFVAFEDAQYATLAYLIRVLRQRFDLRAIRGHCHIAPGRKTDPGPLFDWHRLERDVPLPSHLLPDAGD
jgi:AmpD protein